MIGMPGCGKTRIGEILAEKTGMGFIDMDASIEKDENMAVAEIFSKYGEKYFRELETKKAEELSDPDNTIISTGGGVVLFPGNMEFLKKGGKVFFIERKLSMIMEAPDMSERPLLKKNIEENLKKLYSERIERYRLYADHTIENNADPESAADMILKKGEIEV